jgi:hypothetical protein
MTRGTHSGLLGYDIFPFQRDMCHPSSHDKSTTMTSCDIKSPRHLVTMSLRYFPLGDFHVPPSNSWNPKFRSEYGSLIPSQRELSIHAVGYLQWPLIDPAITCLNDICLHCVTSTSLQWFSSWRSSCFTFETPETPTFEVNLGRSSVMTHGDRSYTSTIFTSRVFQAQTFESPEEPRTWSPEVNLDHPLDGTRGDRSITSTILLREVRSTNSWNFWSTKCRSTWQPTSETCGTLMRQDTWHSSQVIWLCHLPIPMWHYWASKLRSPLPYYTPYLYLFGLPKLG